MKPSFKHVVEGRGYDPRSRMLAKHQDAVLAIEGAYESDRRAASQALKAGLHPGHHAGAWDAARRRHGARRQYRTTMASLNAERTRSLAKEEARFLETTRRYHGGEA